MTEKLIDQKIFYPKEEMNAQEKEFFDHLDSRLVGQKSAKRQIAALLANSETNPIRPEMPGTRANSSTVAPSVRFKLPKWRKMARARA